MKINQQDNSNNESINGMKYGNIESEASAA
jgi:hypothetical protein